VLAISHTVELDEVELGLPDGGTTRAQVVGRDPATDLALLQTGRKGLVPVRWGGLDELRVGHLVVAVYRPGRTTRATLGVVAALGEAWRTRSGGRVDRYLEASLPLQPGFSGGVMVDGSGKALGLSTSGLLRGVALALPGSTVRRVAEALRAGGRVRRGYLGVGSHPVALPTPISTGLGRETGLLLISVQPDSPASRAGLFLGDVVVTLDGTPTAEPADLLPALDEDQIGREIVLGILRGGERREVRLKVGERGASA
jgi:serine protease DegQ